MRAGKLRHKVFIQDRIETKDNEGGVLYTFSDSYSQRASVQPLRGRELIEAQQHNADLTHKVTLRARPDKQINSDQRIRFGNLIFAVTAPPVDVDYRGIQIQVMCNYLFKEAQANQWVTDSGAYLVTDTGDRLVFGSS